MAASGRSSLPIPSRGSPRDQRGNLIQLLQEGVIEYYFGTLDIADFNTIDTDGPVGFATPTGTPRIDWLGGLGTGYGNRPYTGSTLSIRALYRF